MVDLLTDVGEGRGKLLQENISDQVLRKIDPDFKESRVDCSDCSDERLNIARTEGEIQQLVENSRTISWLSRCEVINYRLPYLSGLFLVFVIDHVRMNGGVELGSDDCS